MFERRDPGTVGAAQAQFVFAQQSGAFAHGLFVFVKPRRMGRIEHGHQTIEKAAAGRCAFHEQAVHFRHQPDGRKHLAQRSLATGRRAVHPRDAATAILTLSGGFESGPDFRRAGSGVQRRRDSPVHRTLNRLARIAAGNFGKPRPAQTTARRQERNRFEQVGLAGPVGAGQDSRPDIGVQPQAVIAAEIRQGEPDNRAAFRRCRLQGNICQGAMQ